MLKICLTSINFILLFSFDHSHYQFMTKSHISSNVRYQLSIDNLISDITALYTQANEFAAKKVNTSKFCTTENKRNLIKNSVI